MKHSEIFPNFETMADVGRPPMFENAEALQMAIDDYLENGVREKTVIVGKPPNQQSVLVQIPTITGLAWYIGFESRQSFYDYEEKPEFTYTVKRARLYIEREYEEQLQSGGNPAGPIFALKNMGWKDKTETELSGKTDNNVTVKIIRDNRSATPLSDTPLESAVGTE